MLKRPRHYHSYLLRFWEEFPASPPREWRFSLKDPHTGRRLGFAFLDSFLAYLQAAMDDSGSQQEREGEGA